jgi:hypothetical protein
MKPNVALLKAEIRDELDKIAGLSQEFKAITPRLNEPPERVPFYDRAATLLSAQLLQRLRSHFSQHCPVFRERSEPRELARGLTQAHEADHTRLPAGGD